MTSSTQLDEAEQAAVAAVERLGVPFELIACEPEHADTAAFCARYGYPAERAANTIVVASKKEPKQYAACVVLASTRLDVTTRCATCSAPRSAPSPRRRRCGRSPG
jgi:prolyl-tRNA editing enzyme YbaK/EbsC (Cys-tRNA(Pro) deacylase)